MAKVIHGLSDRFINFCADNQWEFLTLTGNFLRLDWAAITSNKIRDIRSL